MSLQINLTMREIYKNLCPQCKRKLEKMVKEKMDEAMVKRVLKGGKDEMDS